MVGYPGFVLVVLATLLAGCAQEPAAPTQGSDAIAQDGPPGAPAQAAEGAASEEMPPAAVVDRSFQIETSGNQCQAGIAQRLVPVADAQAALPEGYRARDAQALLGAPSALGRGVVTVEVHWCRESLLADGPVHDARVAVYVEDPRMETGRPPVDHHWYELARFSDAPGLVGRLAVAGYDAPLATIAYDLLSVVNGPNHGVATVDVGGVHEISLEAVATVSRREQTVLQRHWHATPSGLLFEDMDVHTEIIRGAAQCELRPGSAGDTAAGGPTCTHPDTLSEVWNDAQWSAVLTYRWNGAPQGPLATA